MTVRVSISRHRARDGRIRHRVRAWIGGVRQPGGLYDTREEAEDAADAIREAHAEDAGARTLASWGAEWLDLRETDGAHRAIDADRSRWRRYVAPSRIAAMALRRIRRGDIMRWLDGVVRAELAAGARKGKRPTQGTVRHVLRLVSRCLGDAMRRGHIDHSPCDGVEVPSVVPEPGQRWTWLRADEIAELLEAATPLERSVYTVAIYAGLRAGELRALRWQDVRLDGRAELHVSASNDGPTKSTRPRTVPLLPPAVAALRSIRSGIGGAYVWPSASGGRRRKDDDFGWERDGHRDRFGRRVRFHDLRHTCASHLVQGTWTPRPLTLLEVRDWLGHADVATSQRYAHLRPDHLHEAITGHPLATDDNRNG